MSSRGAKLESQKQLGEDAAFIAVALAAVTVSTAHHQIPGIINQWIETEVVSTAVTVADLNGEVVSSEDEDRRERAEDPLEGALRRLLVDTEAVKNFEITFRGHPPCNGAAVRVKWDGCPSNSFAGGLILRGA